MTAANASSFRVSPSSCSASFASSGFERKGFECTMFLTIELSMFAPCASFIFSGTAFSDKSLFGASPIGGSVSVLKACARIAFSIVLPRAFILPATSSAEISSARVAESFPFSSCLRILLASGSCSLEVRSTSCSTLFLLLSFDASPSSAFFSVKIGTSDAELSTDCSTCAMDCTSLSSRPFSAEI